jgi:hypothetical protein
MVDKLPPSSGLMDNPIETPQEEAPKDPWVDKFLAAKAKLEAGLAVPKAHHEEAPGCITYEALKDRKALIDLIETFLQEMS